MCLVNKEKIKDEPGRPDLDIDFTQAQTQHRPVANHHRIPAIFLVSPT